MSYAELHCISNFSFLRGASHPGELVYQARNLGYSALALTDECSMAGVVRAYEAAKQCELKLIVGSEFKTVDEMHLVLLAPTQRAYAQICALITTARRRVAKGEYRVSRTDFDAGLDECLALWLPPAQPLPSQAHWVYEKFPQRAWIAVELHRAGARRRSDGVVHPLRVEPDAAAVRPPAAARDDRLDEAPAVGAFTLGEREGR